MWLFKKNKKEAEGKETTTDKVAGKIAGAGIKLQTAFGNRMNKLFENMSQRKLKIGLIAFTLFAGGYSLYLTITAITKPVKQSKFAVDQMNVPRHFNKTGDEAIAPEAFVDEETYTKIQGFKKYMDSLKNNNNKQYDSIRLSRPGIMDSVQMLEEIYRSQKIK
ncbi:MAG: hypothetical protein ACKVOW_13260 [Chitinophagaceae bacterium]